MNKASFYRFFWIVPALIFALIFSGCVSKTAQSAIVPSPTGTTVPPTVASTLAPTLAPTIPATEVTAEATPEPVKVVDSSVLYHDDFTDPTSGWPEAKFDNYFVGYHEPEYYHVEVSSPNYKTTVFEPEKKAFGDVTIEVKAFTASSKTAATGDYSFGVAFRRSGDQYYAFAISQRTKKWYVLKSTPNETTILAQGTDDQIHDADVGDLLRVDAQGSSFSFSINDQPVSQVTDADFASGEVGFYVQSFDVANVHIHFDELTVSNFKGFQPVAADTGVLYHDDFTDPASGWPEAKFDNYFVGYHEPEFYHVEVSSPNYKTMVFEPEKKSFGDVTIEVKAFTASSKTAGTGDYCFGVVFRRSGDQYYAFAISQRTKKWYVLKSTPNKLAVLAEGTDAAIHDADVGDLLRVDAQGSHFSFSINDQLVTQATDVDYGSGEVGFYVQSFDAANVHIHFDELTISDYQPSLVCQVTAITLRVRSGPGTQYTAFTYLSNGDKVEPLGRSADGYWLMIALDGNGNQSWVFNSTSFLTCNAPIDNLPVTPTKGTIP
jgi:hypothetical protein